MGKSGTDGLSAIQGQDGVSQFPKMIDGRPPHSPAGAYSSPVFFGLSGFKSDRVEIPKYPTQRTPRCVGHLSILHREVYVKSR